MINKILFCFLGFFICFFLLGSTISPAQQKKHLKIYIVNSYDETHICTVPQCSGFTKAISKLTDDSYDIDIQGFYMETNDKNTTPSSMKAIADEAIKEIEKNKPDIVYVTDDNAFALVGIPVSKDYPVFFSGINRSFEDYKKQFTNLDYNQLYGVDETIILTDMFKIFEQARFIPDKYYIINDEGSETGYYLTLDYINELKKNNSNYEVIKVTSIHQLNKVVRDLNKNNQGVIIISAQRMFDAETGQVVNKDVIMRHVIKYNTKHLELAANPLFAKLGISMCCAPDFFLMGQKAGEMMIDYLNKKPFERFVKAKNLIAVNIKRLDILGFNKIHSSDSKLINYFYGQEK